jgi:SNF2 family DNA or RNA helicase
VSSLSVNHISPNTRLQYDFFRLDRWNSAKEDQCQNRIHRFGQSAALVRVRKFIVQESVEERIVELQKRKANIASEIYNDEGHDKGPDGKFEGGRLSLDDFRCIFRST